MSIGRSKCPRLLLTREGVAIVVLLRVWSFPFFNSRHTLSWGKGSSFGQYSQKLHVAEYLNAPRRAKSAHAGMLEMAIQGADHLGFTLDGRPDDEVILRIRRNRGSYLARLERNDLRKSRQFCDEGFDLRSG